MSTTFSVIVPTLDRPVMLERALASLLGQEYGDFECVVVDDGSAATPRLPSDPRFRLVTHGGNLGLPRALNTGIEAAAGEYVTFLDDDDELTPDRLASALPALAGDRVVQCYASADSPPPTVNRTLEGRVHDTILDTVAPPKGALVLPRARVPPFDPRYRTLEDLEWLLRVTDDLEFTTVPRVGYVIHRHDTPRSTNGTAERVWYGQMLLHERRGYFARHRRAASLRWWKVGSGALALGDTAMARRALARSLRTRPIPGTMKRLARAMTPARTRLPAWDVERSGADGGL